MSLNRNQLCHPLKISKKIQETSDTVSLVLDIPNSLKEKFKYRAGQFVTLFLDIPRDGRTEEIRRSYSLASSPDYDSNFKISIKRVEGGLGSTYLTTTAKEGDELWVTPPAGLFCLAPTSTINSLVLFAGGSGITPIISILKTALKTSKMNCVLFYQSKNENLIIFKDELKQLETEFGQRLKVDMILSQPGPNWSGLKGRASNNDIQTFLSRHKIESTAASFLCGPDGFMQMAKAALIAHGLEKSHIHIESFASSATHAVAAPPVNDDLPKFGGDEIWIGDKNLRGTPTTIEAVIDGETKSVKARGGATILETLLEAGLNPPYSCMDGACMACMGKVTDGLAYQGDLGILSDENVDAKECLTCQARPASNKVRIEYGF